MTQSEEILTRIITDLAKTDPTWGRFLRRQPAYRYFYIKGYPDKLYPHRFFWTTEPINHKGRKRFASGIYKYLKAKQAFKLTEVKYHVKRKDAKARALSLYYKAKRAK